MAWRNIVSTLAVINYYLPPQTWSSSEQIEDGIG